MMHSPLNVKATLSIDHFCFYKSAKDGVDFDNKLLIWKWHHFTERFRIL